MSGGQGQLFVLFFGPWKPGDHPKIVGEHGPSHLKSAVGEAFGPWNALKKVVLQNPDPAFALGPAALGGGEDLVIFETCIEFPGVARAEPVENVIAFEFAVIGYRSPTWAAAYLKAWTSRAMRSRLEPMKKVVRMLRAHEELLLNCFRARRQYNSGVVDGLNNKARVSLANSYGHRSSEIIKLALYHALADLPEPPCSHNFC